MDELCDRPLKVTKISNIAAGVVDVSVVEDENYIKGGILSNPKLSWVSCGSRISNINTDDGSKRTGWTFGLALNDSSYKVICVEELTPSCYGSPILIVGCESETSGSSLCFYHSGSSRVLKAVHFSEKLTSLAVVSKSSDEEDNLSPLLKVWSGVVAVGIGPGKVLLLDVWWNGLKKCIEDYQLRQYNEQRQSKVIEVTIQDLRDNVECESSRIRHGSSTLALWLNEEILQIEGSRVHPGVQNILGRMPLKFLTVSALKYFPQIGALAVGYNTSCFQLWDLASLTLLHTSALLEAMLPVFSFSLLQPSDDPKCVCYLWSLHHSVDEDNIPFAAMYILSYYRKSLNPFSSQPFYQEFSSCSIRYQLDLGAEVESAVSGRIITCQAIARSPKSSPVWQQTESEENGSEENSATLLVIAWEVWTANQMGVVKKLTMFDLNQWYREYMPQSSDIEYSHFMTHFSLPDGPLLDVKIIPSSVRQFASFKPVDEHFFPSATSFDCVCLQHCQVLACSHFGMQEECLQALEVGGSSALLLPSRLYKMCLQAGIRPLLVDTTLTSQSNEQREYLLSIVMEYGMTQFLRNCVSDWSDGSHAVAGCTLPNLLHWAWSRVERYKRSLDRLCVPLFDFSGTELDNNNLGIFHHMICQLHSLDELFGLVLNKYHNCILQGNFQQQYMAIKLVTSFYDSVLWCMRNKVLPETNIGDANNGHIPYFTDKIVNNTISRRAELHHIAKSLKYPAPSSGLFLIDAVIAQEADGSKLTDQWEREGGSTTMGKYPPPSVQSLLRTYLVRSIPIHIKHFVVSYFLHDIVHVLAPQSLSNGIKQKLLKYPSDFGLTESQCKIIHAFWCLDHKEYENGITLLLDSSINKEDLQLYQHRTVICLLVAAGKHKMALHYLNTRRPGLMDQQDIKMKMTLLLMNNLIHEAFEFQRQHHSCRADLLEQFFTGCVEMNKLDVAFKLPLNTVEEEAFMKFLEKTCHPQADDLRVLYLLSHSRYVEAIDVNEKLRIVSGVKRGAAGLPLGYSPLGPRSRNLFGSRDEVTGAPAKTVLTTRDLIINSVAKSLPSVTRDLADYCSKEKPFSWKQVNRPTPLSVVVHTELSNDRLPFYKAADSTLVQAALSKTRETWAPLLATPVALKRKISSAIDDIPFLRTPVMPKFASSISHLSPTNELKGGIHLKEDDHSNISKKSRLEFSPLLEKEMNKANASFNETTDMDITCPESSALLHTPHVSRVVKQQTKETTTPHSILKPKSAANTPSTPLASERQLKTTSTNRQIRFSLPHENSSSSSSRSVVEEDEHYSPTVSPRKSIHEKSDIQGRKGTPANPRILRHSLRTAVSRLKFDDEMTSNTEDLRKEPSATAASLLKKISSSPVSSEDAYFSFQSSSSSKNTKSRESSLSFNLPLGLEGNIMNFEEDETNNTQQEDVTITSFDLVGSESVENISATEEMLSCSTENSVNPTSELKDLKYLPASDLKDKDGRIEALTLNQSIEENMPKGVLQSVNEIADPKSPKNLKVIVECSGNSSFTRRAVKVANYDTSDSSIDEDNEASLDIQFKSPVFNWSKGKSDNGKERLQLEVNKQDNKGMKTLVSKVALSEQIPLYYSEPKGTVELAEEKKLMNEIPASCSSQPLKNNGSLSPNSQNDTIVHPMEQPATLDTINNRQSVNEQEITPVALDSPAEVDDKSHLTDKEINKDKNTSSVLSHRSNENITINETPLPQVLEEILKRGRISLSIPEKHREAHLKYSVSSKVLSKENTSESSLIKNEESKDTINSELTKCVESADISFVPATKEINNETLVGQNISQPPCQETTIDTKVYLTFHSNDAAASASQVENVFEFSSSITPEDDKKIQQVLLHNEPCKEFDEHKENSIGVEKAKLSQVQDLPVCEDHASDEQRAVNDSPAECGKTFAFDMESVGPLTEVYNIKPSKDDSDADFELKLSEGDSVVEVSSQQEVSEEEVPLYTNIQEEVVIEETAPPFVNVQEEIAIEEEFPPFTNVQKELTLDEIVSPCPNVQEEVAVEEGELQEGGNKELVYETLKPVELQTEIEENILQEDLYDDKCDEGELEAEDVDIYGDIEEGDKNNQEDDEEDSIPESSSESEEEIPVSDIICLGSSSEEEMPLKKTKSSTPSKQRTPSTPRNKKIHDETLDYDEDSYDDYEDEYSDENGEEVYMYTESSGESEESKSSKNEVETSKEVKQYSSSESSESEEEPIPHGNRSWKKEKKEASDDSLDKDNIAIEEENTIESPPYELIGQDSQSESEHPDMKLETIWEVPEKSAVVTLDGGPLKPSSPLPNKENDESVSFPDKQESNSEDIASDKLDNIITSTNTDTENIDVTISKDRISQINDQTADIVKLAEDKRRKCIETGSIHDLKKRRSKRYSSDTDLCMEQRRKLRRKSRSVHDFTSMIIKETAAARRQSENENWIAPVSISEKPILYNNGEESISTLNKPLEQEESQQLAATQNLVAEIETKGMSSRASSLCVEIGSIASAHQSLDSDAQIFPIEKQLGKSKRRVKSVTSRCSSLQDISEEASDNNGNSRSINQSNEQLRRSVSTSKLIEQGHFEENLPRRSSSVSRWSDFAKAHESEMFSEVDDSKTYLSSNNALGISLHAENKSKGCSSLVESLESSTFNKEIHEERFSKVKHSQVIKKQLETTSIEESVKKSKDDNEGNLTESLSKLDSESFPIETKLRRKQRARSEPLSLPQIDTINPSIRRSSSFLKIQKTHQMLFSRYSLRKKSLSKSNFEPLEIVHSDDDSLNELGNVESNLNKDKDNKVYLSENVVTSDNDKDQVSSDNDGNKDQVVEEAQNEELNNSKNISIGDSSTIGPEPVIAKRKRRGSSEPPSLEVKPTSRMLTRRSSCSKLQTIHKLILQQSSRKSVIKSNFQPLEIIHSDEEKSVLDSDPCPSSNTKTEAETNVGENITSHVQNDIENVITTQKVPKKRERKPKSQKEEHTNDSVFLGETSMVGDVISYNKLKEVTNEKEEKTASDVQNEIENVITTQKVPKKRGRKPKSQKEEHTNDSVFLGETSVVGDVISYNKLKEVTDEKEEKTNVPKKEYPQPPKKRGRKPALQQSDENEICDSQVEKRSEEEYIEKEQKLKSASSTLPEDIKGDKKGQGDSFPVDNIVTKDKVDASIKESESTKEKVELSQPNTVSKSIVSRITKKSIKKSTLKQGKKLKSKTIRQKVDVSHGKKRQKVLKTLSSAEEQDNTTFKVPEFVKENAETKKENTINEDNDKQTKKSTENFSVGQKLEPSISNPRQNNEKHGTENVKISEELLPVKPLLDKEHVSPQLQDSESFTEKSEPTKEMVDNNGKEIRTVAAKKTTKRKNIGIIPKKRKNIKEPLISVGKKAVLKKRLPKNKGELKGNVKGNLIENKNDGNLEMSPTQSRQDEVPTNKDNKVSIEDTMTPYSQAESKEKNKVDEDDDNQRKKSTKLISVEQEQKLEPIPSTPKKSAGKRRGKKLKTSEVSLLVETTSDEEHISPKLQDSKLFLEKGTSTKHSIGSEANNDNEEIQIAPTKITAKRKRLGNDPKKTKQIEEPLTSIDKEADPKKGLPKNKRELKEKVNESFIEYDSDVALEMSPTQSQKDESLVNIDNKVGIKDSTFLDVPAKRTRRSMSRLSDSELFTPTKEKELLEMSTTRRTRHSSAMSDIMPTKHTYADTEASDASPSSRLNTPKRRSVRRQSFTATPNSPQLTPQEYLSHRRLTRYQHSQLQKSFDLSFSESMSASRLEDLPEEDESILETTVSSTPRRASSRNTNKNLNYSLTIHNRSSKSHKQ